MQLYNALDLKNGKTIEERETYNVHVQPAQMISDTEKDDQWKRWNMDWLENVGLSQLRSKALRLSKNYKLAVGRIDKRDYVIGTNSEMAELVDYLTKEDESALEIKFYPIIPIVVNVLMGEFSKRTSRPIVKATDEFSTQEKIDEKFNRIKETLLEDAKAKIMEQMEAQGITGKNEEEQQEIQQQMGAIMKLPYIENFMRKNYRSLIEEWGSHQLNADDERFKMYELENMAFYDALVAGEEVWHIAMREDDYEVELWNPMFSFSHKSPDVKYYSQGNYAGNIQLMSISDILDKFGYLMNDEQMKMLETNYPNLNRGLIEDGRPFESYYDPTIPHDKQIPSQNVWFTKEASIAAYRGQLRDDDLFYNLNNIPTDYFERQGFIRVTQAYWRSKVKMFLLTKVGEDGMPMTDWVSEDFVVREKPIYDKTTTDEESAKNLIYGEHIEPIWINQTWKGIKIGSARSAIYGRTSPMAGPIYIDIKPLPFQLKGDYSMYGARLPVEGCRFSDRNVLTTSLVDLMKPYQIAYNIVNNQINDILIDELGSIIILDQNMLPKHSMGEEWERGNLAKAYVAMKNFSMLPLDTSLSSTEERIQYNQHTVLDMSQTKRLLGRIELARYFKEEAFAAIGITPERLGSVQASQTATGTQSAVQGSYAQTDVYFTKHSNFLMPRLKEAILNTAQYYHSSKPSVRLSYINTRDEDEFFEIEGTKLLARDFSVFCSQRPDSAKILDQLKTMAIQNNTSGATLYDLARILQSDSPSEIATMLKASQQRMEEQRMAEMQHEQQLQEEQQKHEEELRQQEMMFEADQNEKDRHARIIEAEIKSSSTASLADSDDDGLEFAKQTADEYFRSEEQGFKQRQQASKENIENKKLEMKKQELASRERVSQTQLAIARENKTQAEITKRKQLKVKQSQAKKKK